MDAEYLDDFNDNAVKDTEVQRFYRGTNVFITGGSGFIGNILIEKLLRSCNINKIYLLLRPKRGKDINKRLEDMFSGPVFENIKKKVNLHKKIQIVTGDCAEKELGLSAEDKAQLINNIHVIFHGAATVRFDEGLRQSTNINVRGTIEILKLAKQMPNLKAVVHISTAFSNCIHSTMVEQIYPPAMHYKELIALVDALKDDQLDKITDTVLGDYPNTYIFTKQIAESVIEEFANDIPIAIVRPSIVTGSAKEPIVGWINNMYGVTGIIAGAALGILRTLYCNPDNTADLVPVDYVANCSIVAAWDVEKRRNNMINNSEDNNEDVVPVFNYVSGTDNRITWRDVMKFTEEVGPTVPSPKIIWHYWFTLNKHRSLHIIYTYLLHYLPAIMIDFIRQLMGKKPMMMKVYQKVEKFSMVLRYFTIKQFEFTNDNTKDLFKKLSKKDQDLFNFDIMSKYDWRAYWKGYIIGMRVYLVGDPMSTIPEGRKKVLKFKIIHYTLVSAVLCFLVFIAWQLLSVTHSILVK
ncbi:fatty acyl-CoA reductase wat-like [Chrysoperla carnea]|uniref:fatty acyl-CoA reductase wat-like n=1 Tax=Chrysoperla carnea TaxID=189513 RepID=UPI001D06D1A9|nr:fatty acyl-CoA reductase wat-like [Chrysoperla carnea]